MICDEWRKSINLDRQGDGEKLKRFGRKYDCDANIFYKNTF